MDTQKLAHRLKKGDETAIDELIDEFTPLIAAIIRNLAGEALSKADVEEVISDTFAAIWFNRKKIDEQRIAGYICCIAKNKARNKIKEANRKNAVSLEEIDIEDEITVSDTVEKSIMNEYLLQAVESLEETDRQITLMYYYYYLSAPKISEMLGINVNTVKTKIRRSREKIKVYLNERRITI